MISCSTNPGEAFDTIERRNTTRLQSPCNNSHPQWGTARFDQDTRLILHFLKNNKTMAVDMHKAGQVIIGRRDPEASLIPDLDLTQLNAAEAGVSRWHIQLEVVDNMLRITDLGSMNGTSVNSKSLTPYQSILLRDGDEVYLGQLKCLVLFKDAQQQ